MAWRFSRRPDPDSLRSRMAAEREATRQNLRGETPDEPARDQPWWKEALGMERTWQRAVLICISLGLFLHAYETDGPGSALAGFITLTVYALGAGWWRNRLERRREALWEPVLPFVTRRTGSSTPGD